MTIIFEVDKQWSGLGLDYWGILGRVFGIRLGFIALHIIFSDFKTIQESFCKCGKNI